MDWGKGAWWLRGFIILASCDFLRVHENLVQHPIYNISMSNNNIVKSQIYHLTFLELFSFFETN